MDDILQTKAINSYGNNTGLTVLMVEDDYINIFMMQRLFESIFNITYAKNSSEALVFLNQNVYDLVLMDINLGEEGVSGVEILKQMKTDNRHTSTKVFAVTGYVKEGDREKYINLGFDEHFPKPLAKDMLIQAIQKFF